jgi:hypothetical protein
MAMIQLTDATVLANNTPVPIIPNTLSYTEGLGEQTVRAASIGGGAVEQVFSNDLATSFSSLKFEMPTTVDTIKLARGWKTNSNQNVFQIAGETVDGTVTRTFTQAAVLNDYEVPIGSDVNISIEITSNPTI